MTAETIEKNMYEKWEGAEKTSTNFVFIIKLNTSIIKCCVWYILAEKYAVLFFFWSKFCKTVRANYMLSNISLNWILLHKTVRI